MALTRKFLSALGIDGEKIDEIIQAHSDTVEALKSERDQMKSERDAAQTDAKKLEKVQKELNDLKAQDETELQAKYNKLKDEYDNYKTAQEQAAMSRQKEEVYTQLLKDAGVTEKRIKSILKVTDLKDFQLDKDGKAKDADELTKSIQKEWSDFIVNAQQNGANTPNPPTRGNASTMTKKEIMSIKDGTKRRQAIAENAELFGLKRE
jgi:DNA repair exonuclease SbcCD ATPase subunit